MKYFSYLNTAVTIINLYRGQQPFHLFIKDFFKQHRKYGSSDRKQVTQLCYCCFRLGQSFSERPLLEKISIAFFLCADKISEMLAHINPEWNVQATASLQQKCALLNISFTSLVIFPCGDAISDTIDKSEFIISHLQQPDLFLRTRPGHHSTVVKKLKQAGIAFTSPAPNCITLTNTTKTAELVVINQEAVIQDFSSQKTGNLLRLVTKSHNPIRTWDCCAASGGKSILAKDILGDIDLTVSDIRESVLINLKKRFAEAGIRYYKTLLVDVAAPPAGFNPGTFQLLIADMPCTGSGTWGRTPERLQWFDKNEIGKYEGLQRAISLNAARFLQPGGYFLYITCSVFKKENEDMAVFIQQALPMKLIAMETIKGYGVKADTMFAALFRKVDPA